MDGDPQQFQNIVRNITCVKLAVSSCYDFFFSSLFSNLSPTSTALSTIFGVYEFHDVFLQFVWCKMMSSQIECFYF